MKLNAAEEFYLNLMEGETKRPHGYKAPHAYRGTPARPRYDKRKRRAADTVFMKSKDRMVPRVRLFKGHRP